MNKKRPQTLTESLRLARSTPGFEFFVAMYDAPQGTPRSIDELLEQINAITRDTNDSNLLDANQIIFNLMNDQLYDIKVGVFFEKVTDGPASRRRVKGKLRIRPYLAAIAEILNNIDVERIKRCKRELCGRLFYAKPAHKNGCSPECCNIISASKSRQSRKCECGHAESKHFKARKHTAAGCEGNGYTCECSGFSIKGTPTRKNRSKQR